MSLKIKNLDNEHANVHEKNKKIKSGKCLYVEFVFFFGWRLMFYEWNSVIFGGTPGLDWTKKNFQEKFEAIYTE